MNRFPVVATKLMSVPGTGQLLQRYNIGAAKQLSQNFIFDQNLMDRIIRHSVSKGIADAVRHSIKIDLFKDYGIDIEEVDFDNKANLDDLAIKFDLPESFTTQAEFSRLYTNRLIEIEPLKYSVCVDIGSGPGGIARSLLKLGTQHVVAVEPDRRFLPILEYIQDLVGKDKMTVVNSRYEHWNAEDTFGELFDTYKFDTNTRGMGSFIKVFGNLPFACATAITALHLEEANKGGHLYQFDKNTELYFMYQLEVARKMCGSGAANTKKLKSAKKTMNPLFRTFNHSFDAKFLQEVNRKSFTPVPNVDAGIVKLVPNLNKMQCPFNVYRKFIRGTYVNRKKLAKTSVNKYIEMFLRDNSFFKEMNKTQLMAEFKEFAFQYPLSDEELSTRRIFHLTDKELDILCCRFVHFFSNKGFDFSSF
eukprot:Nk52_evm27s221 gene=Nk52_evmTU27s221